MPGVPVKIRAEKKPRLCHLRVECELSGLESGKVGSRLGYYPFFASSLSTVRLELKTPEYTMG